VSRHCLSSMPAAAEHPARGLEVTWRIIQDRLMTGSSAGALTEEETGMVQAIWGLLDHHLPYAGQLSLLLRRIGMPGVDI
jgi:hypothetical protein